MITIRRSQDRGHFNHGWLETYHTFSFADYYDPDHMGFGPLRVMNEDRIDPGMGFDTHPHRDMEILTYILAGVLEHKDSMGNGTVIEAGQVQRMTAGTGVMHSEFNPSQTQSAHLYQIWIKPREKGLSPSYEQKSFSATDSPGELVLIGSQDGREGSVTVHQDVDLYLLGGLADAQEQAYKLAPGRQAWLQVLRGQVSLNGHELNQGDGAAISQEDLLTLTASADSELLLFDLA